MGSRNLQFWTRIATLNLAGRRAPRPREATARARADEASALRLGGSPGEPPRFQPSRIRTMNRRRQIFVPPGTRICRREIAVHEKCCCVGLWSLKGGFVRRAERLPFYIRWRAAAGSEVRLTGWSALRAISGTGGTIIAASDLDSAKTPWAGVGASCPLEHPFREPCRGSTSAQPVLPAIWFWSGFEAWRFGNRRTVAE